MFMRFIMSWRLAAIGQWLAMIVVVCGVQSVHAEEPSPSDAPGEEAIRAMAREFVEAFNRGDAEAVAAQWTENGSLVDDRGQVFKGREAIQDQYVRFFKDFPGASMEVVVRSVDFPAATMAVEEGLSQVTSKHGAHPVVGQYVATHVLVDGKWRMATVRESAIPLASNFNRLQELDWLIGDWQTIHDGAKVHSTFRWIAHHSFVQRDYTVRDGNLTVQSGTQIIGWDPQLGQIRSWSFDSTGGYGTGLWAATPDGWRIDSEGILSDGFPVSSVDILIRVAGEDNVLGWQSTHRKAGDTELPDTPEIVLDRVTAR